MGEGARKGAGSGGARGTRGAEPRHGRHEGLAAAAAAAAEQEATGVWQCGSVWPRVCEATEPSPTQHRLGPAQSAQWRAAAVPTSRRLMSLTQEGDTLGNEARRLCRMGAPGCHQSARRIVLCEPPASRAQGSDRVQGQTSQSATTWSLDELAGCNSCESEGESERGGERRAKPNGASRAHRWTLRVLAMAIWRGLRWWCCGCGGLGT